VSAVRDNRPRKAAVIGVGGAAGNWGADPESPYLMGIGWLHARAYEAMGCRVVAAASRTPANRAAFGDEFPDCALYADYRELLERERPELVSICAYADTREGMVLEALRAGARGIWAEKPLCLTATSGEAMLAACERAGARIVVNHYRRYLHAFERARTLIEEGAIGAPVTLAAGLEGWDLMEMGSHWFDLFRHLLGDPRGDWVLAQVECRGKRVRYGHLMEDASVAQVRFDDGTTGWLAAGAAASGDPTIRVIGTLGMLEVRPEGLRMVGEAGVRELETDSDLDDPRDGNDLATQLSVLGALLDWMDDGPEPAVSGRNAFRSAELYLAAYESALRRERVGLPIEGQENFPLDALAAGSSSLPTS